MAKKQEGTKREVTPDNLQGIPDVTHEPLKVDNAKVIKATPVTPTVSPTPDDIARIGRPPLFETPEQMQEIIDEYFDWSDNRMISVYNKDLGDNIMISNPAPYTMSGLARRLGMDRRSFLNYSKKDEFFPTINAARQRIEEDVELRLMEGKNQAGAIFNLKNNFGYVDKIENEHSMKELPKPIISLPQPDQEEDDVETL